MIGRKNYGIRLCDIDCLLFITYNFNKSWTKLWKIYVNRWIVFFVFLLGEGIRSFLFEIDLFLWFRINFTISKV